MKEEDIELDNPDYIRTNAKNGIQSMAGDITSRNIDDNSDAKFEHYDNNSILGLSTYEHDKCFIE